MTRLTKCQRPHCGGTLHVDWDGDLKCLSCGRVQGAAERQEAPKAQQPVRGLGEPCVTCGKPKQYTYSSRGGTVAYCPKCQDRNRGRRNEAWAHMPIAPPDVGRTHG